MSGLEKPYGRYALLLTYNSQFNNSQHEHTAPLSHQIVSERINSPTEVLLSKPSQQKLRHSPQKSRTCSNKPMLYSKTRNLVKPICKLLKSFAPSLWGALSPAIPFHSKHLLNIGVDIT